MEIKKLESFLKTLLNCMAESVFSSDLPRSVGTMHTLLSSRMLREFVAGSEKAWTYMPMTILKSSMGTIEKSNFPLHVPSIMCTPCAIPVIGLASEFTAFIVPSS